MKSKYGTAGSNLKYVDRIRPEEQHRNEEDNGVLGIPRRSKYKSSETQNT